MTRLLLLLLVIVIAMSWARTSDIGHADSTGCLWVLVNAKALGP